MNTTVSAVFDAFHPEGLLVSRSGPDAEILRVAPAGSCAPGDLVFVDRDSFVESVRRGAPAAVVTTATLADRFPGAAVLVTGNVRLAQARITARFFDRNLADDGWPRLHPSAVIHGSASVASTARVGPGAVVGRNARVGERCIVKANAVIEEDAAVGDDSVIHANAVVGAGCRLGRSVIVGAGTVIGSEGFGFAQDGRRRNHRIPQLGTVEIGDGVRLGANCTIDRATFDLTRIGAGCVFDNGCHVGHNVEIGEDGVVAAQTAVAGSVRIGRRLLCSGHVSINDHLEIPDDVVLYPHSYLAQSLTAPGGYAGFPAQPVAEWRRNQAVAARLAELRERVRALERETT